MMIFMLMRLQLTQTTDTSNKINTFIRTQIFDAENFIQNKVGRDSNIQYTNRIIIIVSTRFSGQTVPLAIQIKGEIMQTSRFIDFSAFFFYRKILADSSQELFRRQAIQVFYNTVVINNGQLVSRETNGHEVIIFFMAVCFPANQLTIIDYNRVVKDLNGLTPEQFLTAVSKNFTVEEKGTEIYKPAGLHNFSLYLDGKWYSLTAKPGTYNDNDPIGVLDVTISSNLILDEVLGIKDLRSDKRIDFVGGAISCKDLSIKSA